MVWFSVHPVMAMDIFKIQNVNVVQNAGALGTSEMKRRKTQILPPIVINWQGYLSDSFLNSTTQLFEQVYII
jgi:ABC-type microcin C transport system permease subunit YejE